MDHSDRAGVPCLTVSCIMSYMPHLRHSVKPRPAYMSAKQGRHSACASSELAVPCLHGQEGVNHCEEGVNHCEEGD